MKYTCPECNTKDIGELDICDNDCKTIICVELNFILTKIIK